MSPFLYLIKRNFINYIKNIKHNKTKIIPFVFYFILIVIICLSSFSDNDTASIKEPKYFIAISTAIIITSFLFTIYSGISRKNFRFTMSDVNLIFTSPIRPQNTLLYGFVREISFIFAFSLFFLFQIPNILNHFKFANYGILIFFITLFIFCITLSFISLLMYGIFSRFQKYKTFAVNFSKCILAIFLISTTLYIYQNSSGNYFEIFTDFFNKNWWGYIPVVGWTSNIITQCLTVFNASIFLNLGLLILTCILCGFILYNLNLDYYEDALPSAEQNEVAQSYKNSGFDSKQLLSSSKARKPFARRKVSMVKFPSFSKAIFYRHILEYKKTGFYFVNLLTLFYLIISIAYGLWFEPPLSPLLYLAAYLIVTTLQIGKWSQDFNNHFIFLIPDSSTSKLLYSTLSSMIKYIIDGCFIFIPAGILLKVNPLEIIFGILSFISFGAVCTYGGVLSYKLFDKVSNQLTRGLVTFLSIFIFIIPGILIGNLLSFYFKIFGPFAVYISIILYNTLISIIIIQKAKNIYDDINI